MIQASPVDFVVIAVYFLAILLIGTLFGKFTKTTKDFFLGGQRFAWWLIAMSCVATVVGSYSFVKYSAIGYNHGLSSTMTYLNDWFIVPFFVLGWLPIIYFNRIASIPEYFEKRYNKWVRLITIVYILIFMIGYVGINFYTLGTALQPLLNIGFSYMTDLFIIVVVVAIIGAVYMHAGGQTSVIMTDLIQGFVLLIAGFLVLYLGLDAIGGVDKFWSALPAEHKLPFSHFNKQAEFPAAGIFWQDAAAGSIAFYFMNQGVIMRFLSCKSPREGKRAVFAIVLVLMPLAVLAIANTGWLGRAMVELGMLDEKSILADLIASNALEKGSTRIDKHIFTVVTAKIAGPGVFGFILAALTAAMMSTIDTLINAISAIFINDIYKPIKESGSSPVPADSHYLKVARYVAIGSTVLGVALVVLFAQFESIYAVHGMFTASITPPVITLILLSIFSKRITPTAAIVTLIVGGLSMLVVVAGWNAPIEWLAHGIPEAQKTPYKFIRALYGILVCVVTAVVVSYFTRPKPAAEIKGLVIDSLDDARRFFKGGTPNDFDPGLKVKATIELREIEGISISVEDMQMLAAQPGDLIYFADKRWWLGGLKSNILKANEPHEKSGYVYISRQAMEDGHLSLNRPLLLEKQI